MTKKKWLLTPEQESRFQAAMVTMLRETRQMQAEVESLTPEEWGSLKAELKRFRDELTDFGYELESEDPDHAIDWRQPGRLEHLRRLREQYAAHRLATLVKRRESHAGGRERKYNDKKVRQMVASLHEQDSALDWHTATTRVAMAVDPRRCAQGKRDRVVKIVRRYANDLRW